MKTFILQTINDEVCFDFEFHLIQAINYQNWYNNEKIYDFKKINIKDIKEIKDDKLIPIGSMNFVFEWCRQKNININKKPINIPQELMKKEYLMRNVCYENKEDINLNERFFIKSNNIYKDNPSPDIISKNDLIYYPNGNYLVSDVIDIDSEYRCFVHNKRLVGIQNYSGNFEILPDIQKIKNMIKDYKDSPLSYTLDVGINNNGTFIIEVHPFVSCGLYGFSDYRILCYMFENGFNYIKRD